VTTGPLIDETKRVKVHETIIGACAKDVSEVATRQALFRILRIPLSGVELADALDSLRFPDKIGALGILES
jgi:hypothetical protein